MPEPRLRLGQALAYLKSDQNNVSRLKHLGSEDQKYVKALKGKMKSAPSSNRNFKNESELEDYIVASMLTSSSDTTLDACVDLHKRLNDSYRLFCRFTDIMRDFYHTSRELGIN
ncbi:hypothetical protein MJD09_06245 [bacterium]|nr:hypothetical protein [bacterium]